MPMFLRFRSCLFNAPFALCTICCDSLQKPAGGKTSVVQNSDIKLSLFRYVTFRSVHLKFDDYFGYWFTLSGYLCI